MCKIVANGSRSSIHDNKTSIYRSRTQSSLSSRSNNESFKQNSKLFPCSCKTFESDTISCTYLGGVTTPRFVLGRDILQASLTIIPQAAHENLRGTHFRRTYGNIHYGNSPEEASPRLPTRHSKSLDQLEQEQSCITFYGGCSNDEVLEKTLKVLEMSKDLGISLKKHQNVGLPQQREDFLKNINEFKQKYKNPGTQTNTTYNNDSTVINHNDIELKQFFSTELENVQTKCTLTLDRFPMKRTEISLIKNPSPLHNGTLHFNSLPKNSTVSETMINRQKKYSKHLSTPSNRDTTLIRSKSTQNLARSQKQQRTHHSFRYSRVRIMDNKHSLQRKNRNRRSVTSQQDYSSSSSTDNESVVKERCKTPRAKNKKKHLSSTSVPQQLNSEKNDEEFLKNVSDSIPSSSSSSPRLVKSESLKINGERTQMKLNDAIGITDVGLPSNRRITHKSNNRKGVIRNFTHKKRNEKSKSEFDLPNANDIIEDLQLIPPEQFRDTIFTPLPPEEFRDSDEVNLYMSDQLSNEDQRKRKTRKKYVTTTINQNKQVLSQTTAIDNPLYHMCEINDTKMIKSQSTNELLRTERKNSCSVSLKSLNNHNSQASSPKSLQRVENSTDQPPLLEFEKSREEFRKQVNYEGSIYSDFTKLASELPYFYISDELRIFSPNGLHLIICVHGM